jgi:hypothetical protein
MKLALYVDSPFGFPCCMNTGPVSIKMTWDDQYRSSGFEGKYKGRAKCPKCHDVFSVSKGRNLKLVWISDRTAGLVYETVNCPYCAASQSVMLIEGRDRTTGQCRKCNQWVTTWELGTGDAG